MASYVEKIGKFHVLGTLGHGAHSTILHVRRDADQKEYALKVVTLEDEDDKKYLDQAKHELRVGHMLFHPNLVTIHCLETESDWLFRVKKAKLLIEYVPGKTLDQVPVLKMARLLRVFEKIAAGLVHMHKNGVLHADLKPNNIILGQGTRVKILDFGLARVKADPPVPRVQGTPEYMAPETGEHKLVNERTDIYNFGATMYRLVTFKLPPCAIRDESGLHVSAKTFHKLLKPVNELNPLAPPGLVELIHQCLSYDANARPERMSAVQGTLDRLADEAAEKLTDPASIEE